MADSSIDTSVHKDQSSSSSMNEGEESDQQNIESLEKNFFHQLRNLLIGYGDNSNPYSESIQILEDLVIKFIIDFTTSIMEINR